MDGEERFENCAECGATIYPEHLQKHVADQFEGKLLCPYCLREHKEVSAAGATVTAPADEPEDAIDVQDVVSAASGDVPLNQPKEPTRITSFGSGPSGIVGSAAQHDYRRQLLTGSPNATRCKTFHCKLADGPIVFLNEQINDWVDAHDDIEIKFATSTIGVIEGKHVDPHLIITVFY